MRGKTDAVHELLADYGRLLYEAAYVLALVADAAHDERAEEHDVLSAVESESTAKYLGLVDHFGVVPDQGMRDDADDTRRLASSIHALFGVIVQIGEALVDCDADRLPQVVVENVRLIKSVTRSLTVALDDKREPAEIERCLWAVQLGADAINRSLTGLSRHGDATARPPGDGRATAVVSSMEAAAGELTTLRGSLQQMSGTSPV